MTTDQLLLVLATLLAGVALVAWPFASASTTRGGAGDDHVRPAEAVGPTRCEVVLVEATAPDGTAVRAVRLVVEASSPAPAVRSRP